MEANENSSPLSHQPDPPSPGQPVNPASVPTTEIVRCPYCGGSRIRRRSRPLVINAIACLVTLLLTPVVCAMALGALVSFVALPVTTCIAVVGRHRCRDCRRRFELGDPPNNIAAAFRFPWAFHAFNIAVLLLLCVVGPHVMRVRAGAGKLPDLMGSMSLILMCGFLVWGSLLYHLTVYHILKRRRANRLIWAALLLLPGMVAGAYVFHASSPRLRMQSLLAYAQLAPLPESATGVRFYSWSSPFSGEDFLRFTADADDIERFLANSPALQGQEPIRFSSQRMRLKYPRDDKGNLIFIQDENQYFVPDRSAPSWYTREIKGPARTYRVQPPEYQFPGEVLVDDQTNTVYIYLCFS